MKRRKLEMMLERLEGFASPDPRLEQYSTPATIASELLYSALLRGDLEGTVCDLGSGTGVLAIGAAILGARVVGVEIDPSAIRIARENARRVGAEVQFVRGDVANIGLQNVSTVVMNPPFGAQKGSYGDRAFLRKATETAEVVYSIHNAGSEGFIRRFVEPCKVEEVQKIAFPMKRTFKFHTKDLQVVEVELYRIFCR
ncbi:METTL5 family protein [Candidatus Methanocrinis natronophilus]|uniref:Methyltransferase-like protein 5 n=1 Tax=Candidatus Methanocrinis natronophilus TaxID=3033396 RepID=A0ABT5XAR9_9EURY|nr:METTL5 family protein [Candidatus Methanocrinis natronophilus]MDF0591775.1 METTL5 family protein [Candidatus Methanocrinis natronophilus]